MRPKRHIDLRVSLTRRQNLKDLAENRVSCTFRGNSRENSLSLHRFCRRCKRRSCLLGVENTSVSDHLHWHANYDSPNINDPSGFVHPQRDYCFSYFRCKNCPLRGVARFCRFNMTMTGAIQNTNMKIRELVIPEAEACVLDCKSVFKYNFVAADTVCFRSLY